jgi:hypothetical protein
MFIGEKKSDCYAPILPARTRRTWEKFNQVLILLSAVRAD